MKTKSWIKPVEAAAPTLESFDMLADAYLSVDGSPLAGPFSLYLCMHKALDMSRFARDVELQNADGETLLRLSDSSVGGHPLFIDLFKQLRASARTFYADLSAAVRAEVNRELGLEQTDDN